MPDTAVFAILIIVGIAVLLLGFQLAASRGRAMNDEIQSALLEVDKDLRFMAGMVPPDILGRVTSYAFAALAESPTIPFRVARKFSPAAAAEMLFGASIKHQIDEDRRFINSLDDVSIQYMGLVSAFIAHVRKANSFPAEMQQRMIVDIIATLPPNTLERFNRATADAPI